MTREEARPIVREVLGEDLSEADLGYLLWNETGFPVFWNIPQDGETPEECLRTQLRRLANRQKRE